MRKHRRLLHALTLLLLEFLRHLKSFFKGFITFLKLWVYVCEGGKCIGVQTLSKLGEGLSSAITGVSVSCQLSNVSAGNQNWILCKSSTYSEALNSLIISEIMIPFRDLAFCLHLKMCLIFSLHFQRGHYKLKYKVISFKLHMQKLNGIINFKALFEDTRHGFCLNKFFFSVELLFYKYVKNLKVECCKLCV